MSQPSTAEITITHPLGLHLRKSRDVVQVASRYDAEITACNLTLETPAVDAKSILQLMQLQARQGHTLRLCATGLDAQDAIDALSRLFNARFYDLSGSTSP